MNRRRAAALLLFAALTVLVTIGAALSFEDHLVDEGWRAYGGRPFGPGEIAALDQCDRVAWKTLVRVLEQDRDVACGGGWLPAALDASTSPRGRRWLERVSADVRRPVRTRLRAGLAAALGGEPPPGLSLLLTDPSGDPEERRVLIAAWAAADSPPTWAEPQLVDAARARRYEEGDLRYGVGASDALRLEAQMHLEAPDARAARVDAALSPVGLGPQRLEATLDRIGRGLPLQDVPPGLVRTLRARASECAGRSSASCLRLAADLIDAQLADDPDGGPPIAGEPVARGLESVFWEVAFSDRDAVAAAERRFATAAAWIGAAGSHRERRGRLLGLVAHPRNSLSNPRDLPLGEPLLALMYRRASPWATAAAAMALGARAGVGVRVESLGDGVVVDVEGRRVGIGPCGAVVTPPAVPGAAWSLRDVLAAAAIERAGSALRAEDVALASRMASLAETLDPIGAEGVFDVVVARAAASSDSGWAAGRAIATTGDADAEAAADRQARAGTWSHALVEWNEAGRPACPSTLGP